MSLDRVKELIFWARGHGAHLHLQIEVYDDPDFGVALRVQSSKSAEHQITSSNLPVSESGSLPAKSRIISCPFNLSLSYLNALNTYPGLDAHSPPLPKSLFKALEPHAIGCFFFIQQYLDVENSYWAPYIRSLPQHDEPDKLSTPLYFSKEDLAWIQGTDLQAAREQRQYMWKTTWETGRRVLDFAPGWEKWRGRWTWGLFKWAATIFSSRSFTSTLIPDEIFEAKNVVRGENDFCVVEQKVSSWRNNEGAYPILFPVVDLANHSSTARVTWFSNVNTEPKDLNIIVDSEIPEGYQVFNNYAPKNNAELLLGYGFCIPGNDEVAIAFKSPTSELAGIRARHLASLRSHSIDASKSVFHIRISGYNALQRNDRLVDFTMLENGCIDALSVLVANERELEFMSKYPFYCVEQGSEQIFAGPFSRNILKIISVLHEKLQTLLDSILSAGVDLRTPKNLRQNAAKIYRDGQISTLQAALAPLEARLDSVTCQHTFCTHAARTRSEMSKFSIMQVSVELVTLGCAFSWLKTAYPNYYRIAVDLIKSELDLEKTKPVDWIELIDSDWDFTLWCFWLYMVILSPISDDSLLPSLPEKLLKNWIDHIQEIYVANHGSSASETFQGDNDERETIQNMISKFHLASNEDRKDPREGRKRWDDTFSETPEGLLNFASKIVAEESLRVSVRIRDAHAEERVMQRVLCVNKFADEESRVSWKAPPEQF